MNVLEQAPTGMTRETFDRVREIIHRRSGIALGDSKEVLVRARLAKRMRTLGLTDYGQYLARVEADATGEELVQLLDVVSTNVTSFFREEAHFRILTDAVRRRIAEGQKRIRLWSAACSSGQEPYTMAMTCLDAAGSDADLRILATDLSTRVLDRAKKGAYDAQEIAPVPAALRDRYFHEEAGTWKAGALLRSMVSFARMNLVSIPYPMAGPFDAIFCRNVMIYFDVDGRRRVVTELMRLLRPGGLLFVGHAESLADSGLGLRSSGPSVYVKP